ncbi:MAG: DNA polymerase III subunit delta [Oligoflexales bacterium]|nr:DNA polymerase III subunit delta [Oligoflexales bacterium]
MQPLAKADYKSFMDSLASTTLRLISGEQSLVIIYGDCDYLLEKALSKIKSEWRKQQLGQISFVESDTLNPDVLSSYWSQRSFFAERNLAILRRIENFKNFEKIVTTMKSANKLNQPQTTLVLTYAKEKLPAPLHKALAAFGAALIPCKSPRSYELPLLMPELEKAHEVRFSVEARQYFLKLLGHDFTLIDNELKTLSLIYADQRAQRELTVADLQATIAGTREDEAFQLSELLLQGKDAEAELLLLQLLKRNESPLGILALLARHCRQCLLILEQLTLGQDVFKLAPQLGLPPFVIKKYLPYLKKRPPKLFEKALSGCFEADIKLKSTSIAGELVLIGVLSELCGS